MTKQLVNSIAVYDIMWDEGNRTKCRKHGVSIADIETVLRQNEVWVAPDVRHSQQEKRHLAIGKLPNARYVFVVFTLRAGFIRPISARFMHKKEVKVYETQIAGNENG